MHPAFMRVTRLSELYGKISLVHKVVVGFAAAFLMVLVLAVVVDTNRQKQIDADRVVAFSRSLIDELEATLSVVKDAETGARGYVITGDESYLVPYQIALSTITDHVQRLRVLVARDTTDLSKLEELEDKIARRLKITREVVALRKDVSFAAAQQRVLSGEGKVEMDAIRALVAEMQEIERGHLAEVSKQSESITAGAGWLLAAVPFCLGFIALISTQIRREMNARQRAEQALIASEGKFKAIVENTSDPIFMKDTQGRYTMINRAGSDLLEMPFDEIIGTDDLQLLGEVKGRDIQTMDRKVLESGKPINYESPLTAGGKVHIFNTGKYPYLAPDGSLLGIIGISRDVTTAREAELKLRKQKAELSALNETTIGLLNGLDTGALLEKIVLNTSRLLDVPDTFLYVLDADGRYMTIQNATGLFVDWIGVKVLYGEGLAGLVWQNNKTIYLEDYGQWEHRKKELDEVQMRAIVEVPLRIGGEVVGVLGVARTNDDASPLDSDDVALLSRFAQLASVALQNANLYTRAQHEIRDRKRAEEALHELAIRDELTGLYNRREFMRLLKEEVERCRRYKRPLSLILMDIDFFKKVNDTYGHQMGDSVLSWVSGIVKSAVRTADRPARYGGEEFAVIVPELGCKSACEFAERLRCLVSALPYVGQTVDGEAVNLQVTLSLGVASFPPDGHSVEALIAAADNALYEAKRKGRNRAVMYSSALLLARAEPGTV